MKILTLILFTFLLPVLLNAQYQNPSSLKWGQVKTAHFRVIFPDSIKSRGIETANLLEKVYYPAGNSLNTSVKNIPVLLFNQEVISNGYTALAPRHMGYFTTPPQDASLVGGTDWLQILTIHEFRHAVQMQKLDQNINSFFGSLFGDFGKAVCMNVTIPYWVLEGDAVCTETIYSSEGRGRLPSFTRDIRALEQENTRYSYYKAYLGSYKDYFPNHYYLGYLMTSHIRRNYGDTAWNNIITRTTWAPFYPFIFSNSLKHYTGNSISKTYRNCMNEFDSIWMSDVSRVNSNFNSLTETNRKLYTRYSYPSFCENDKVVALKTSLADPPTLVCLEEGIEKELIEINPIDRIHSNGKSVVWSSVTSDIRWGQRSYANILLFNLSTGNLKNITTRGKYFAPAISPDGSKIAAIKYGDDLICSLVVLNSTDGKEEFQYVFDPDQFARMPGWSSTGEEIVLTVSSGQQRNLSVIDLKNNTLEEMLPYTTESISNPAFYSHYIFFNSTFTGSDAIHALDLSSGERFVVATSNYGVYNPCISSDGMRLVFQNYTTMGNDIVIQEIDIRQWIKLSDARIQRDESYKSLIQQENSGPLFDKLDISNTEGIQIKKYRPLLHAVNVHSWVPLPITNGIELSLYSKDLLNTTSLKAGIDYFAKDVALREFFEISYGKYFPVFDIGFSNGQNYKIDEDPDSSNNSYEKFYENVLTTGITLPFNFSRHIYTTTLSVGGGYNYIYYRYPDPGPEHAAGSFDISVLELTLNFSRSRQKALRDLNPRYAQEVNLTYWNSPFANEKGQSRLVVDGHFYLPGLAKHHSLILSGGMEKNTDKFRAGIYKLTTDLEFIRGYERDSSDMISRGTIEYSLPLLYPDLSFGALFYLKRISTNLFYDHGLVNFKDNLQVLNSIGMDLNFDFHLCNYLAPIQMGVRYSYRLQDKDYRLEVLVFGVRF